MVLHHMLKVSAQYHLVHIHTLNELIQLHPVHTHMLKEEEI
jgi:hypothetical protein